MTNSESINSDKEDIKKESDVYGYLLHGAKSLVKENPEIVKELMEEMKSYEKR